MQAAITARLGTRAGRREWVGLAVLALPTLLVSIDVFVMLMALPRLSSALGATGTQQLWIADMYGFTLSGCMVTMGTLGDRIGRRRLLLMGAAGFAGASILAAFSTSPTMLIAARALLGIAGATLAPSILALISDMFRDPAQRATAIGAWLVCFMGGAVLGPVVGGTMLEHLWWGSVFLLGVPAMALLLALGPVLVPESRNPGAGRLDLVSVAQSLAAILPVVYGLKELARGGWRPLPVLAIAAGVAFAIVFVRRQRRLEAPLVDVRLFTRPALSTALVSMLLGTMLMGAIMLFVTQHLQLVEGLSPLRAGLALMPAVAASIVSFQLSPIVARRVPVAHLVAGGLCVSVAGLLVIAGVGPASELAPLVAGWTLVSLGAGPLVTLGTNLVIGSVPPENAGSAAAVSETSNELGFALGIAILGSLATAIYQGQAFSDGLRAAAAVSAVALAGVIVLVVTVLRHVQPLGEAAGA